MVDMQFDTFPFKSLTCSVTVFAPAFEQVNSLGVSVYSAIPHASVLPLSISSYPNVVSPLMLTVADLHRAIGLVKSFTVAVPVQVEVFPLAAVAVKVTTLVPTFEQLNVVGVKLSEV